MKDGAPPPPYCYDWLQNLEHASFLGGRTAFLVARSPAMAEHRTLASVVRASISFGCHVAL